MTNFDKIKNTNVEELANTMSVAITDCCWCPICEFCKMNYNDNSHEFDTCSDTWEKWLKSEVEE